MAQGGPPLAKALVLVVMGSTGAGKTQLGTELALRVNGEVINADAMQVYDELPIATNRATQEEMCGVPHHLLACVCPLADPPFSVLDFRERADKLVRMRRSASSLRSRDRMGA